MTMTTTATAAVPAKVTNPFDRTAQGGPNLINHVVAVIDASTSMTYHARRVVEVADAWVAQLAEETRRNGQETRITVYLFHDDVYCLVFDKDVLRLPSLASLYRADGNTALIAGVWKAIEDLEKTAETYGDHAYLLYVLTDGEENVSPWSRVFGGDGSRRNVFSRPAPRHSRGDLAERLRRKINELPENWSLGALVPDERGVEYAVQYGFPRESVTTWDTTSSAGVEEAFSTKISQATTSYMTSRAAGVRGTKTLFAGGLAQVNAVERRARGMKELAKERYTLFTLKRTDLDKTGGPENLPCVEIRPFVERNMGGDGSYVQGRAFYELLKAEKIQPQKALLLRNRKSGRLYDGDVRGMLGLPNHEVRVKPETNPEYQIFVQSTSTNRNLYEGSKLVVLHQDPV